MYLLMSIERNAENNEFEVQHWCFADGESLKDVKLFAEKIKIDKKEQNIIIDILTILYCKCSTGKCNPVSIYQTDSWKDEEDEIEGN
jgi:hypothetical protein